VPAPYLNPWLRMAAKITTSSLKSSSSSSKRRALRECESPGHFERVPVLVRDRDPRRKGTERHRDTDTM
jgi:hypothetical protein